MAEARKCDRCGELYELYEGIQLNEGRNFYRCCTLVGSSSVLSLDLCPKCMTDLIDWIKARCEVKNDN